MAAHLEATQQRISQQCRLMHLPDITGASTNVRFREQSGHWRLQLFEINYGLGIIRNEPAFRPQRSRWAVDVRSGEIQCACVRSPP